MKDSIKGGALTEVSFYILLSLYSPRHGYAIMQFVNEKTDGRLSLGAGTLYGALTAMEEKGWISRFGDDIGRRKEYIITPLGRETAENELSRLRQLICTAEEITGGKA